MERAKKVEELSQIWMGNNMDFDNLQKVLKGIDPNHSKNRGEEELSQQEVKNEWNRLKAFMGGKK